MRPAFLLRYAFDEHLVTNNVNLIHPEHPSSRRLSEQLSSTGIGARGGSLLSAALDQFFSAASTQVAGFTSVASTRLMLCN